MSIKYKEFEDGWSVDFYRKGLFVVGVLCNKGCAKAVTAWTKKGLFKKCVKIINEMNQEEKEK